MSAVENPVDRPVPEPLRPTWAEINRGSLDVQWIEVQGAVCQVTNRHLAIGMKGGRLLCSVPGITNFSR